MSFLRSSSSSWRNVGTVRGKAAISKAGGKTAQARKTTIEERGEKRRETQDPTRRSAATLPPPRRALEEDYTPPYKLYRISRSYNTRKYNTENAYYIRGGVGGGGSVRNFLDRSADSQPSFFLFLFCLSYIYIYTSWYPWPSGTVKSPGFFKLGSCFSFFFNFNFFLFFNVFSVFIMIFYNKNKVFLFHFYIFVYLDASLKFGERRYTSLFFK